METVRKDLYLDSNLVNVRAIFTLLPTKGTDTKKGT